MNSSTGVTPPRAVEVVGLPGVGKTSVVDRVVGSLGEDRAAQRLGRGHRRDTVRSVCLLWTSPASLPLLLRIVSTTARGVNGTPRARARRAWKVFKGLARIVARRGRRVLVLDEGPVGWLIAATWRDPSPRDHAISRVLQLYERHRCVLVHLDGDDDLVEERRRLRAERGEASGRRGAAGLYRAADDERRALMDGLAARGADRIALHRVPVDREDTPDDLARAIVSGVLARHRV